MSPDNPRTCPACGSADWQDLVHIRTGRVMTSDQRILPGELHKVICGRCGLAANSALLTDEEAERIYGDAYELNTRDGEEHLFYTAAGPVPRSQVFFDWISPHLPAEFQSLLEIGCGAGNVLHRFRQAFPGKRISGLEGSHRACSLAKAKGLAVERGLILDQEDLPPADVILAIGVLEHVEPIDRFLTSIRSALTENGRAIFIIPVQDYPGCDLFFAEHVWHLTVSQCRSILSRHGFEVLFSDPEHPVYHGFGLFVCRKAQPGNQVPTPDLASVTRNRDTWLRRFRAVDAWLKAHPHQRIALFGASEVATLLLAFTSLGDRGPVACIDEDPLRIGTKKHGIEVVAPGWLASGKADAVLLAANPRYHAQIKEKLGAFPVDMYSFAEEEQRS